MKKISITLLTAVIIFSACSKNNNNNNNNTDCSPVTVTAPESEVSALKAYLDSNNITATADSRGFYYNISDSGVGTKPTVCNTVGFNYYGAFTNGKGFDSGSNVTYPLNYLIVGWQEAIPLIASGGSMTLYLPPTLGYGANDYMGIPGGSILIFKIDLLGVQ